MLKDFNSSAIVAVSDIARAKQFYGETLGLERAGENGPSVVTFKTGHASRREDEARLVRRSGRQHPAPQQPVKPGSN